MTSPIDTENRPLSKVERLRRDAADAAEVRSFLTHPDVVALRVEKIRTQVDGMIWAGLLLGLAFTMVNVQTFAAAGAGLFSLAWCAAWLLDPMVSLVLVAVLRAEQVTARWQVPMRGWVTRTKRFAFAATYVMNTWQSWAGLHAAGIVLHSVPPVLVYCAAEAGPVLRDRLTEAVLKAGRYGRGETTIAAEAAPVTAPADTSVQSSTAEPVELPAAKPTATPAPAPAKPPARRARRKTARKPAPRKLLADYLSDARDAYTPGTEITPAWARQATGCSKGLSSKVAAILRAEHDQPADEPAPVSADEPADELRAAA